MPRLNGIEATRQILQDAPTPVSSGYPSASGLYRRMRGDAPLLKDWTPTADPHRQGRQRRPRPQPLPALTPDQHAHTSGPVKDTSGRPALALRPRHRHAYLRPGGSLRPKALGWLNG
jgi:hypothetical protein